MQTDMGRPHKAHVGHTLANPKQTHIWADRIKFMSDKQGQITRKLTYWVHIKPMWASNGQTQSKPTYEQHKAHVGLKKKKKKHAQSKANPHMGSPYKAYVGLKWEPMQTHTCLPHIKPMLDTHGQT